MNNPGFFEKYRIRLVCWLIGRVSVKIHSKTVIAMALHIAKVYNDNRIEDIESEEI